MIALIAPLGLVALAALAVPILIHLVRQSERKPLSFAALRWLSERTRPRKQLRLHERLLLLLRLLLLTVIALLLAIPVWRSHAEPSTPWVVVAPGVDADAARAAVDLPLADWHWLAPGFPAIERGIESTASPSFSSLVRQLDTELPGTTALTIVVPDELAGLDAERLRLGRAVDWRVLPGQAASANTVTAPASIRITVRHDIEGAAELPVIRALAKAWEVSGLAVALDVDSIETPIPAETDWLFWLASAPSTGFDTWVAEGGTALRSRGKNTEGAVALSNDDSGTELLRERPFGRGRIFSTPNALTTTAMPGLLEPDFPKRLCTLLAQRSPPPDRALAAAIAPLQLDPLPRAVGPVTLLDGWIAVFAALLFLAERLLATRTGRSAA